MKLVRAPRLGTEHRLHAEGRVIHAGRRTATAEGDVLDTAGRICAHATTTCLILGE